MFGGLVFKIKKERAYKKAQKKILSDESRLVMTYVPKNCHHIREVSQGNPDITFQGPCVLILDKNRCPIEVIPV